MPWPKWLIDDKDAQPKQEVVVTAIPTQSVSTESLPTNNLQGIMDPPQHEKWNNFFNNLINTKGDPQYLQFIKVIEGMGSTIAENVRFASVFLGMKQMGLTKQQLIDSANKTMQFLINDADSFKQQIESRLQSEVIDPQKVVAQKEQEVKKLQQEISDLTVAISIADNKIALSKLGYTTYSKQAQAKISNDIGAITNYIQE